MTLRTTASILLLTVSLFGAACAEQAGTGDEPTTPATVEPTDTTPAPLEGASCDRQQGGVDADGIPNSSNVPDFVDVEITHEDGIDRIVFVFRPEEGAGEVPAYGVEFVDQLFTDAEGAPVEVAGEFFVQVNFTAVGVDLSSETPEPIYTGPQEFDTGLGTLLEAEQLGDFESIVTWGLGLSFEGCPRVTATPSDLTIEFPAA